MTTPASSPVDGAPSSGRRSREAVVVRALVLIFALALFGFAYARYATYNNRTFDLAFYARMAWGMVRGDLFEPIVGANLLGLHVSLVLVPIGIVGAVIGTVPALLAAQALAVALAAVPLARLGARHLGPWGAVTGAAAFLLHPNVGHVATYEFHPGTLAVLPLAYLVDALDRRDTRAVVLAAVATLACREDLALITAIAGVLLAFVPGCRRAGALLAAASLAYGFVFFHFLHPAFKPEEGSLEQHFGQWGDSVGAVLHAVLTRPADVAAHLATPERLSYLPRILAPMALLPLFAPRYLLLASPILGIALLSDFPTTTRIDSHYLTSALPMLVGGGLVAAGRLAARVDGRIVSGALLVSASAAFLFAGGLPPAAAFDADAYRPKPEGPAIASMLERIPAGASVQAPDSLLPHLAERRIVHRGPPPERGTDYAILDLSHRRRFAGRVELLRTQEEPHARAWFARDDHHLLAAAGDFALLRRGAVPRAQRIEAYRDRSAADRGGAMGTPIRLTSCLSITGAEPATGVLLFLEAHGPCPEDLAIRVGVEDPSARDPEARATDGHRVELLFDGLLSPAHLRAGDRLVSHHTVEAEAAIVVGVLRTRGDPPDPSDPRFVRVPLEVP